ncbi:hypothetical protein [Plantibacter sp. YIM 135249]|uniref:hypothetical protein n=1 Tax=Plantibacter sp. YIM 135249 TaxID=3423918 RepID=UPI003D327FDF
MSGKQKLEIALYETGFQRPRTLWQRLTYPALREVFEYAFKYGYANGHMDAQSELSEDEIADWFARHSSPAVSRVVDQGERVIAERAEDGVMG